MKEKNRYFSPEVQTTANELSEMVAGSWNDGTLSGNPEEIYEETL